LKSKNSTNAIQQGWAEDGIAVSLVKLRKWFQSKQPAKSSIQNCIHVHARQCGHESRAAHCVDTRTGKPTEFCTEDQDHDGRRSLACQIGVGMQSQPIRPVVHGGPGVLWFGRVF